MNEKSNAFLETEPVGSLMRRYAIPCIISLLVASLYNIVDQIFIANASYLGSYGNAANTVVFPLTVVALALAVMIGDGCCAFVSISLGSGAHDDAHRSIGCSVILCVIVSLVVTAAYLIFDEPILTMFGGRVNEETFELSKEYFFWITLGIPFYMFGQAMNPIIRSDGSPRFAMAATVSGAVVNIILDPLFIFGFKWGMMGAAVGLASGCIPIVGYNIGAGRNDRAKQLFKLLLLTEAAVGAVALVIVECFPGQLIAVFGAANESEYYTLFALRAFRIYLSTTILACVNKATFIYLQSLGKAFMSTLLSMVREVLFGVGFALLLPVFFGLDGILLSMPVSYVLTFVISAIVIIYTNKALSTVQ